MTVFAITIWAWELTHSATALALVSFFFLAPSVAIAPFTGVIVDRSNRKHLIMLGDMVAGLCTIAILLLHLGGNVQLWHIYLAVAINGLFSQLQFARKSLLALLLLVSLFGFAHDISDSLYSSMILARTGGNAQILASLEAAAGVGGVTGALLLTACSISQRRIHGVLLGMIGAGFSKIIFGLSQMPLIWISAQFCSSLNFPLMHSSEQAIWLTKVEPDLQGRVFASHTMISRLPQALGRLLAGPLADYMFEPAMMPEGNLAPIFREILGTGSGVGMALLYVVCALCMLLIGIGGYAFPALRDVEDIVPDSDATTV